MVITNSYDYSSFSTGMHFPRYYRKVSTRFGEKVHLTSGSAPECGSGSGHNRHPRRRFMPENTIVTCEKCLEHQSHWQQQAWLIFMEADH
jgi:hypothetical protein